MPEGVTQTVIAEVHSAPACSPRTSSVCLTPYFQWESLPVTPSLNWSFLPFRPCVPGQPVLPPAWMDPCLLLKDLGVEFPLRLGVPGVSAASELGTGCCAAPSVPVSRPQPCPRPRPLPTMLAVQPCCIAGWWQCSGNSLCGVWWRCRDEAGASAAPSLFLRALFVTSGGSVDALKFLLH